MALRKPVVQVGGQFQQLQSGDSLDAPQAGGDVVSLTNDEASPITLGMIVYPDAVNGVKKARSDAVGTRDAIGLVKDASIANGVAGNIQVNGPIDFGATATVDALFGTTGGFAVKTRYYLSATTAGSGTPTAPSTGGQSVVEVGIALSATILDINIRSPILL